MRWILACALLSASAVQAADAVESAKELAGERKLVEAATVLGKAIAKGQRAGDVPAVVDLCDKLIEIVGSRVGPRDDPDKGDGYREVCHALLNTLDAKRRDAVLSAPLLATEIVLQAERAGDDRYLEDAVKIIAKHGKDRKAGLCAATMATFAQGLLDTRKGEEGAPARVYAAYRVMIDNGWLDLAVHAGTELVANRDFDRGLHVLAELQELVPQAQDTHLLNAANDLLRRRLRGLDIPGVEKGFRPGPGAVGAAGGKGGAGGSPSSVSRIGERWKRLARAKAFVSVTRAVDRFAVDYRFDGTEKTQKIQPGVKHQEHGGVTVSFWGPAVRLAMVDLVGNRGRPGEGSGPESFEFFWRLAPGETWSVDRRGVVEIRPAR